VSALQSRIAAISASPRWLSFRGRHSTVRVAGRCPIASCADSDR